MGKVDTNGSLCWRCHKAAGAGGWCSWSAKLKPVKGWEAKETNLCGGGKSYFVIKCPEFVPDPPRDKTNETKILSNKESDAFINDPKKYIEKYDNIFTQIKNKVGGGD